MDIENIAGNSEGAEEATSEKVSSAAEESAVQDSQGKSEERTSDSEEDSLGIKVSLDELPEEARKYAEKVEKDFKRAYTKKTQEWSDKSKATEHKLKQLEEQSLQYKQMMDTLLKDPSKVDAYRKLYGYDKPQRNQEPAPKIETVDDLINYYENKIKTVEQSFEQKLNTKLHTTLAQKESASRWETAASTLAAENPKFNRYKDIIVKLISDNPAAYKDIYYPGNEKAVFTRAYEQFTETYLKPELEEFQKKTQATVEQKKKASTIAPKKTVQTDPGKALSGEELKKAVLARVQARFGK